MSSTMTTVAVTGIQELTTIPAPVPECGAAEVLVRVAYCGICGSDVPRYFDGGVHSFPQVLGHEFSGIVESTGSDVTRVSPGDRVAVAPLVPCHACPECLAGRPALCPNYSFIGSRQHGALAEYVTVPEINVVPVGDLDLKVAALIEPLTVAIHGVERLPVEAGQDAAVLGGGVIGLMAVITLRAKGVRHITVVDVNPWALEMATRFGATHTINVAEQDLAEHFASIGAPQVVVETAGAAPTRRQALTIAARNGSVVYIGTPSTDLILDPETFEHILRKELLIRGSWMSYSAPFPGSEWTQAPELLAGALGDPAELVSHVFSLDEVADGFAAMRERDARRLKVMFRVGGDQ